MKTTIALIAALFTNPANAFTAQNGLVIAPQGNGDFAIAFRGPSGPTDFWCAAGDYAIRKLHLSPTQVIYRTSEPPRRAGEPIQFSLDATKAASRSGVSQLGVDDAGFSAGTAQSFCEFHHKTH